jgi:hypothetical protein
MFALKLPLLALVVPLALAACGRFASCVSQVSMDGGLMSGDREVIRA